MPPKKKEEAPKKIHWGRPGNTLKMGLVGLPNVGKSSTFNVLSKLSVPAENYPFCTVDPNLAKVDVPDERFNKLVEIWKPKKQFQATLNVFDIAGLVKGASQGEGLGNAFLSHINQVDAIFHVVRAFDDPDVTHVDMEVDPIRDLNTINAELVLKDIEACKKALEQAIKLERSQHLKEQQEEVALLQKVMALLEKNIWVRNSTDWLTKDIEKVNKYLFLTTKPVIYLVNLSEADFKRKKNKWLPKIAEWIKDPNNVEGPIIPYSADFEKKILDQSLDDKVNNDDKLKAALAEEQKISMIPKIIKTGYKSLDLIYYFTMGHDEVKCWTIRDGTKAPGAAGVIHGDFEKGFICADVQNYEDFMKCGGNEAQVKAEGKLRQQGKEYVVQDGDCMFFKFNVSGGGKK